jgi:hypothetical protein
MWKFMYRNYAVRRKQAHGGARNLSIYLFGFQN